MGLLSPKFATCREVQDAHIARELGKKQPVSPLCRIARVAIAGMMTFALVPVALTGCSTGATSNQSAASTATETSFDLAGYNLSYTDRECDPSYNAATAETITLQGDTATTSSPNNVSVGNGSVTIYRAGVYVVSGTLNDGQIIVRCPEQDKAKVQIVFDGVDITCNSGSAVFVEQADKVFITLADGSSNTVRDASAYSLNQDKGDANAAIYSQDDLVLQGSGSLTVEGNYKHGIHCKDSLVITGGTYNVTSVADAIRGKNSLKIKDGVFEITSGEDAIKSSNDTKAGKGFVVIDGGTFKVSAGDDAFHAETLMLVNDGKINVSKCYEGLEGQIIVVNGGETYITASDDGLNAANSGTSDAQIVGPGDAGANRRQGGGAGRPPEGGPDGAPGAPGGPANNEGPRPENMNFGDPGNRPGNRPAGGPGNANNESMGPGNFGGPGGQGGGPGGPGGPGGMMDGDASCGIQINGGYLVVNSSGDGVDSNGNVEVNGGVVLVDGPTSNGDAPFDYGLNATISGGTVVICGSQGMAQSFTTGSQPFCLMTASGAAGQSIAVSDEAGKVFASFSPQKKFQCVLVSAPGMIEGATYNLVIGGVVMGADASGFTSDGSVDGGEVVSFVASTTATSIARGGGRMP